MITLENKLFLGASEPFTLLQVSDLHFTRCDSRDSKAVNELAEKRKNTYPLSEARALQLVQEAKTVDLTLCTGDTMDFVSHKNLEAVTELRQSLGKCIFMAGNHDFRPLGGMQYDVPESRKINFERTSAALGTPTEMYSEVINGVNLVCLEDIYYRFNSEQLEFLKNECAKGLPVLLCLHVPLYTPDLYDHRMYTTRGKKPASMINTPPERMQCFKPERIIQQTPDEITREMYSFIINEKAIKAVLAGHVHFSFITYLRPDLPQLVTGINEMRKVTIV